VAVGGRASGDLVAILEALKRAGALRAELEIIQGWAWRRPPGFGKASACNIEATAFRPLPFAQQRGGPGEGSLLCFQRRAKARATPPQPSPAAQGRGQAVAVEPAPGEPVAILEALKRAGALRAELEII
jgi:hypothetical protein